MISSDGQQVGIVANAEAYRMAQEEGLDLVEISPTAKPPVCKIMDYGKYCYELQKKEKEAKKKQSQVQLKEVKFTPKIGEHDYQTKLRNCIRFLNKGNKLKISVFFRGREKMHQDLGDVLLNRLIEDLEELSQVDKRTKLQGNNMFMVMSPLNKPKK